MSRVGRRPRVNPFSTRFVQPGAIPFRFPTFPSPDGLAALVLRLGETRGWGQIIGPHGSGKSTLLAALLPVLSDWRVCHIKLNTTDRRLLPEVFDPPKPGALLVIDGFEQLGFLSRWRVKRHCRKHGCGLLVTAHTSMGLPDLYRTAVTPRAAAEVVAELAPESSTDFAGFLDGFDIPARLRAHHGSLREVLFELYDRWEAGM